jgi:hypothetical protein
MDDYTAMVEDAARMADYRAKAQRFEQAEAEVQPRFPLSSPPAAVQHCAYLNACQALLPTTLIQPG